MASINKTSPENSSYKSPSSAPLRPLYQIIFFWTLLIAGFAALGVYQSYQHEMNTAFTAVKDSFKKDLVYRKWATMHGGVYVPITEQTPPNPYLSHIRDRDITTPSGRQLTLINPAYMTRQVHELGKELYGLRGHITSLKPIRPENAPDSWEITVLKEFEKGKEEVISKELIDGKPYVRFMHSLIVDEGCLKCHASQGYIKEDVRGGISVSVPWEPFQNQVIDVLKMILITSAIIWMVGTFAIVAGRRKLVCYLDERNSAEKALLEAKAFTESALNTISDIFYSFDVNGKFLYWNKTFRIISGYTDQELSSMTPIDFFSGDDIRRITKAVEKIYLEGASKEEACFVSKDGSRILCEFSGSTLLDSNGTVIGFSGTGRDITERKLVESAISESEEKYRILFRDSPDAYLIFVDGVFIECNRATEVMLRGERAQIVGLPPERLSPEFQPDGRKSSESAKEKIYNAFQSGCSHFEWVHRRLDGSDFFVEVSLAPMTLRGKTALFTTWRDISGRKKAELEKEAALASIKKLEGIIPICIYCKKIRDDANSWNQLEQYITDHSEALFSHGMCPACSEEQMKIIENMK